jgi:hypothetical protein
VSNIDEPKQTEGLGDVAIILGSGVTETVVEILLTQPPANVSVAV